jgi:hypothetical protein
MAFSRVDIDWVRLSSSRRYVAEFTPPATPILDGDTVFVIDFDDLTFDVRGDAATVSASGSPTIVH